MIRGMKIEKRKAILPEHSICNDRPAKRMRHAFRSGNGTLLLLDYGNPAHNKITLTHEELYTPQWEEPPKAPLLKDVLGEIQDLLLSGEYEKADTLVNTTAAKNGTPPHYRPNYAHDGLWIETDFVEKEAKEYLHIQNMRTGELTTLWKNETGKFETKMFCSRKDGLAVLHYKALEGTLDFRICPEFPEMPEEDEKKNIAGEEWLGKILPPSMRKETDERNVWILGDYPYHHGCFVSGFHLVGGDCEAAWEGDALHISGGKECCFLVSILRGGNGDTGALKKQLLQKMEKTTGSYEELIKRHKEIHTKLFDRVSLHLGKKPGCHALTLAEMLEKEAQTDHILPEFLETLVDMGRYFLLCECGKFPPIYGHVNINVNHQVSSANIASLPEMMESFMGWIERQLPDARENAERVLGTRGFVIACHPDMESGKQYHFNTTYPHEFWISSSGWCLQPFLEYYYCTGDEKFRKNRMIPLYRELLLLYKDFLTRKDENGKWIFVPSYSPENYPSNKHYMTSINAAMDVEVCREVMEVLLTYGVDLITEEEKKNCQEILEALPDYLYGERGEIKEWIRADLEENHDHRHISQLYGAYPGDEFQPERSLKLYRHARVTNRIRGMENESCHGIMHRAQIAARLKDSMLVEEFLRFTLESGYVNENFSTAHNPYRDHIFPDGQGAIPTVVIESLVYARPGFIEFLPAADSRSLEVGELKGVSLRSAARLEKMTWDKEKLFARIFFRKEQEITFCFRKSVKLEIFSQDIFQQEKDAVSGQQIWRGSVKTEEIIEIAAFFGREKI